LEKFNNQLDIILYISKGIALEEKSTIILMQHFILAVNQVVLRVDAKAILEKICNDKKVISLKASFDTNKLINNAKNHKVLFYEKNLKNLVHKLRKYFRDENICYIK